jgi:hypothetical protein
VLIFWKSVMRSSRSRWCEPVWNAALDPLAAKTRFETSRLNLNEKMRVVSACERHRLRSNISLTCSSNESGTPIGAPGSSRGSAGLVRLLHFLDAPLDLADIIEVVCQARAIDRAQLAPQIPDRFGDPVENALVVFPPSPARSGVAPTPKS